MPPYPSSKISDSVLTDGLDGGELLLVLVHEVGQPVEEGAPVPRVHATPLTLQKQASIQNIYHATPLTLEKNGLKSIYSFCYPTPPLKKGLNSKYSLGYTTHPSKTIQNIHHATPLTLQKRA